jgi:hypothetical protein
MAKRAFSIALLMVSILVISASAASQVGAIASWRDISPNAYLNPFENPKLGSVYMFPAHSLVEGWAVGDAQPLTNATTSLPSIFHFDGSVWNLVPAPKFSDFPSNQCPYNLNSVNFGPPNNAISEIDGWAVGGAFVASGSANTNCFGNATAIHWDGVTWRVQVAGLSGPDAGVLASVYMVSSTDVWAVGRGMGRAVGVGVFWHWTGAPGLGGAWNLVQTVSHTLNSVFMVSSTEGWAVGDAGSIYHYFGGTWTAFSTPVTGPVCPNVPCALNAVFMLSPTDGWTVGTNGLILHYTSGTWSGPVSPGATANVLLSVFMVSSGEGWAVGGGTQSQKNATILHYTGGTWTALPINLIPLSPIHSFSLNWVYFTTPADGWAVGTAGVIVHFDGVNWGASTSPTLNNFTSISFGPPLTGPVNPNDGWAVGNATFFNSTLVPPFEPTIFHWNGYVWTKGVAIGATNDLNSVFMLNGGDAWAVGGGPRPTASCSASPVALCPIILHFSGGSWNTVTPPQNGYTLKSVFMVSPTEGWSVGEQAGTSSDEQAGTPPTGIILHYTVTGGVGTWAVFPAPTSPSAPAGLNSVFMLGPNEGWAVGDNATILHYTVTGGVGSWNVVSVSGTPTLSTDANLTSIFMLSPTSGWAVGGIQAVGSFSAGPVILYWDGAKWSPVATPSIPGGITPVGHTSATLKSVFCSGPNDCWAAGYPGKIFAVILHWNGIAWNHMPTIPALLGEVPPILTSIYMIDPNTGWIVGADPEFPSPLAQSLGGTVALSTILRAAPRVVTVTLTSTLVSTVSTQTVTISTILTSISSSIFQTTSVPPVGPGVSAIPIIIVIVVALAVILALIGLLFSRRRRRGLPIYYLIPRRP